MERGLENVTIEDITAEADVSVRTFGNYFASKYEAICALGTDRARRIGAELLARPAVEPLWSSLVACVLTHSARSPNSRPPAPEPPPHLTEEEFQALVRPAIFGPNGPLCSPPGQPDRPGP